MLIYCCQLILAERITIYMSKNEYRTYFVKCMKVVKMTHLVDRANISRSNFSKFINDTSTYGNALISIEKLELLHQLLLTELKQLIT